MAKQRRKIRSSSFSKAKRSFPQAPKRRAKRGCAADADPHRGWHRPIDPSVLANQTITVPLDPDQRQALEASIAGEPGSSHLVTGPAGCGKSQVVKALKELFPSLTVTATTGMAALQVGGTTVDRYFGFDRDTWKIRNPSQTASTMRASSGIVVVDEASMAGADMARCIMRAAKEHGKRIILVGDLAQAKPVKDDWAVATHLFSKATVSRLTTNHRQVSMDPNDRSFLEALGRIRIGEVDDLTELVLKPSFVQAPPADDRWVRMFATNAMSEQFNLQRLYASTQSLSRGTMRARFTPNAGSRMHPRAGTSIEENAGLGHGITIGTGARVIITTNDPEHQPWMTATKPRFANGDTGTVDRIIWEGEHVGAVQVILDRTGQMLELHPVTRNVIGGNGSMIGTVMGIPLRLGWAVTIHRSQGMTLDRAFVDVGSILSFPEDGRHGLVYVALSRVRTLAGLQIMNWNRSAVWCDPVVKPYL